MMMWCWHKENAVKKFQGVVFIVGEGERGGDLWQAATRQQAV
jgi:hypothetical protein